jgi:aspartate carbamoyltransferase catalytic subunit
MKHFLDINRLSVEDIQLLIEKALLFKREGNFPKYESQIVAQLFYENSTRTRVSFELAAKQLGMKVINLDVNHSSESKGELIEDTLAAMGIHFFVIRHHQNYMQEDLAKTLSAYDIHIVNAGDGTHAHPSQAILDLMTIMEDKPNLRDLKIAIVGNIKHSRVANSFQNISAKMGVGELVLVAPKIWQPEQIHYGRVTSDLEEGIRDADVIISLRVQNERLVASEQLDMSRYRGQFALTEGTLKLAKADAIVMHPGPLNRGIEIDSSVADGPHSRILTQVQNGVFVRMAILDSLVR